MQLWEPDIMRRSRFISSILLLGFGLMLPPSMAQAKPLEAATSQAGVASTENLVEKSGGAAWSPCQVGDILVAGNKIRTGKDSTASLLLADHSVMRLAPNTELLIVDLTEQENGCLVRRFQLSVGRLFNDVTPGNSVYEVRGPNAVAAVHGTLFEMEAQPESPTTDVKVIGGTVECKSPAPDAKSEMVKAGPANYFRSDHAGTYQRTDYTRENTDWFMMENIKTSQNWREKFPPSTPRLTSLTAETMQPYQHLKARMEPKQRSHFNQEQESRRSKLPVTAAKKPPAKPPVKPPPKPIPPKKKNDKK